MTVLPPWLDALGLPPHLDERIQGGELPPPPPDGAYVVYWMRTAARGHENPALDVARELAARLGVPFFVYHALSERYPYASDRHHTFALEGARDVQAELAELGVGYAFHLERPEHRGPHLRTLAAGAAAVVTEAMPVPPLEAWTQRLASQVEAPVLGVDTACVVPMPLTRKAYDRAFAYRKSTDALRHARVDRPWPAAPAASAPFLPAMPFEPVDLRQADLQELVAACEIDHGVGPVPHTPGGSRAGYARWRAFLGGGLARYAADRNDPLRDGVSRMSAYLHYGHVSPLRLAREAAARTGKGPEKYLDELLVWRELAYTFCFHDDDVESVATLPRWAQATLAEHEADPRPALPSLETLARGGTGDPLWDAAQVSLLRHGELHNNVRMTWGKALLSWTPDAATALARLIDLNHRYALDGRDPSSYGGLLWCLGGFDRAFEPARPILGRVRPRPTREHARRLDVAPYAARTGEAPFSAGARVAVVGAGISGLACARTLADHGLAVHVVEAEDEIGGRVATVETAGDTFDAGAQYFTARDPRFARAVGSWLEDGVVAPWEGRLVALESGVRTPKSGAVTRYVGVPGMARVAEHLAEDLDVATGVRVTSVARAGGAWHLEVRDGSRGPYDAVVVATPAPVATPLLASSPGLQRRAAGVTLEPVWAALVAFAAAPDLDFDGAFVNGGPLTWVAHGGSKPQREADTWVLHASPAWTRDHRSLAPDDVARRLVDALGEATGVVLPAARGLEARLWPHAIPPAPLAESCLFDADAGLAACGDWCGGPRVEGAYLSGVAAAGRVLGRAAGLTHAATEDTP